MVMYFPDPEAPPQLPGWQQGDVSDGEAGGPDSDVPATVYPYPYPYPCTNITEFVDFDVCFAITLVPKWLPPPPASPFRHVVLGKRSSEKQ